MLTTNERVRLIRRYRNEPRSAQALLAKCAAGIAVIALLAVIGLRDVARDTAVAPQAARSPGTIAASYSAGIADTP